jgi:GWxTD domain-containing protein
LFQNLVKALKYFYSCLIVFVTVLLNCSSPRNLYSLEENIYRRSNLDMNIKHIVYHKNDSVSQLFFLLPNENLVYKRTDTSSWFYAQVKVKYAVLGNTKPLRLIDSGSVWIYDRQPEKVENHSLRGVANMKIKYGGKHTVEFFVFDLNKKVKNSKLIEVDKMSIYSRQNFLLQNAKDEIIYTYYLNPGDTVYIKNEVMPQNTYTVDYFKPDFPIARPCFSLVERPDFGYKPDSSFEKQKVNGKMKIVIPPRGFYHIVNNTNNEGLTLFSVDKVFPGLKDETEMIKSTQYIMDNKVREYRDCLEATNKKAAIDEFWKDIAGSNERAKELLKKYYQRVTEANKLFTSHMEGWKTDRGMIYIVMGVPTTMYKSPTGELWIYGNEADPMNTARFNFQKMLNFFTDNDFVLERREEFKASYTSFVTYWREGHIYYDN